MRIALLSDTTSPTPTEGAHGLGAAAHFIAEGLLARGHEVVLFALKGSRFSGELVTSEQQGQEHEPQLAKLAYDAHKDKPFDVFYDHGHLHTLSRLFIGLNVVNHYHDQWQPTERCPVVCSEAQKMSMKLDSARVIHHQLNPRDFVPSYRHDGYLAYLGILRDYKQPLLAVEVAARLDMPLRMAGTTPHRPDWLFSGNENVTYMGPLNAQGRNELLRGAAVMLQFGHMESFGLTTVEAGLCGTPVVGWPAGGSLDTIEDGVTGTFVNTFRAPVLTQAAAATEQAMTLKRKPIREHVAEKFGRPDKQLELIEQALEDCAAGRWW